MRRIALGLAVAVLGGASAILPAVCGPFTDVAADAFCPLVLEIFYLGITTGTTPSTYDPASLVSRLQMAAFLSRSVDGVLRRSGRRAALAQFWTPQNEAVLGVTTVGDSPAHPVADGADVWVPNTVGGSVSRVRASDGRLLETWTGAAAAAMAVSAGGMVVVTGIGTPGKLYRIVPSEPAGSVTTVAANLGDSSFGLAFDGARFWTANQGSLSIVTPGAALPWTVTTVSGDFGLLNGAVFDGGNIWVTDNNARVLQKLDSSGAVLQTVTVGVFPELPVFDGSNIWVPNFGSTSVSVVRAGSGAVLATLTGNGLSSPSQAAFDGERILVTNIVNGSVSLWKAADLTVLGNIPTGILSQPVGACSDGVNFWITFRGNQLGRF